MQNPPIPNVADAAAGAPVPPTIAADAVAPDSASDRPHASAAPASPPHRPVRSFVLRGGRMGPGQRRALEAGRGRWCLAYAAQPLDWPAAFGREGAPRVVEIGFGMGHATALMAAAEPAIDLLGLEVHEAGVGALLKAIGERGIGNLRIVQHDAIEVLTQMIAPGSLQRIHVFFPDPWPKKRHHKRRLVQPPFARLAASRLAPGGVLHLATDWQPYAEQMREVLRGEPLLRNLGDDPQHGSIDGCPPEGWVPRPAARPPTKFEQRGLALGHPVHDLLAVRVAQDIGPPAAPADHSVQFTHPV